MEEVAGLLLAAGRRQLGRTFFLRASRSPPLTMQPRYKTVVLEARGCLRDLGQLVSETPVGPKPL